MDYADTFPKGNLMLKRELYKFFLNNSTVFESSGRLNS